MVTFRYDWRYDHREFDDCPRTLQGEYVPMVWEWWEGRNPITIPAAAQYILGFNEPNKKEQADMTPEQAAGFWHEIEDRGEGKLLVSPAPAKCKPSNNPNCHLSATDWLDQFFEACDGCRVDFVALHLYSCNPNSDMRIIESIYKR